MHVSCYNVMMYVEEGTVLQGRCEFRPQVWGGDTFVLLYGMEQLAWCECTLNLEPSY